MIELFIFQQLPFYKCHVKQTEVMSHEFAEKLQSDSLSGRSYNLLAIQEAKNQN